MSTQAVYEYLIAILERYQQANKSGKTRLLNEAQAITRLSRKQLIRRLSDPQKLKRQGRRSGRPVKYLKNQLQPHLYHLWVQMERISARRMKAGFKDWLRFYDECPSYLKIQLTQMSVSTLDRYLKEVRSSIEVRRGLSSTCPARYMKNKIPLNTFDQKITKPGFTQADTVAHCGSSLQGVFINSLTLTDIFSEWTENRAIFTKKAQKVRRAIVDIENSMPFKILGINFDSGSEFLNNEILQFGRTGNGQKRIALTRSRPYKKNDNCYVEQKNYTHVRELFGYERFEEEYLVKLMNEIYKEYWNPLQNFFLPHFKLKEKKRVGSKIIKKYDAPQTPFERLIKSDQLTEEQITMLKQKKASLNPFKLKQGLESKLKTFFEALKQSKIREIAS